MKTVPYKYHCSSSQAFDDVSNTLRIVALPALTSTATRISHDTDRPIKAVTASMARDSFNNGAISLPTCGLCEGNVRATTPPAVVILVPLQQRPIRQTHMKSPAGQGEVRGLLAFRSGIHNRVVRIFDHYSAVREAPAT